eukprot:3745565-Rhodomonas_salina.2
MTGEERTGGKEGQPTFSFTKEGWPAFVREAKRWLYTEQKQASWPITIDPARRAALQDAAAPLEIPRYPPILPQTATEAALQARANQIQQQLEQAQARQKRLILQQQMTVYNFLEKHFQASSPNLFHDVDITSDDFASKIFTELHDLWKPSGSNEADTKAEEKDELIEKFNREPQSYFENLIHVNSELRDLGARDEVARDLRRAGDAIYRFALRENTTPMEKRWEQWLTLHRHAMVMEGKADSLMEMQISARKHLNDQKRIFKNSAGGDEKSGPNPAMFHADGGGGGGRGGGTPPGKHWNPRCRGRGRGQPRGGGSYPGRGGQGPPGRGGQGQRWQGRGGQGWGSCGWPGRGGQNGGFRGRWRSKPCRAERRAPLLPEWGRD